MTFPATTHNTTGNYREDSSSSQHVNTLIVQPDYLADNNALEMRHVKNIIMNERVSIQVSAPGWITFTAISLMKFMGKLTGSEVGIEFLE